MFDKAKQMNKLLKLKKTLKKTITVHEDGEWKITVTGEQKVKEIIIEGESRKDLVDFVNKGLKKSQQAMVKKMSGIDGGLGNFLK